MVKLKCIYATVVPAPAATTTLVLKGHQPNLPATLSNRVDQIGSAICIAPPLHPTSLPRHSHLLYQLSYRGMSCKELTRA